MITSNPKVRERYMDTLVTDSRADPCVIERLRDAGVQVILAPM